MEVIFLAVLLTALVLPFRWVVEAELARWGGREEALDNGVVVRSREALDEVGEVIGRYGEHPIHASVTFKALEYGFVSLVPPHYTAQLRAHELFLAPGFLYRYRGATAAA